MSKTSYSKMTASEIDNKVNEIKEDIYKLRMRKATGELENVAEIRNLRREIARALTVKSSLKLTK